MLIQQQPQLKHVQEPQEKEVTLTAVSKNVSTTTHSSISSLSVHPSPSLPPSPSSSVSMTWAVFVTWVLPMLLIATFSRSLVDTSLPTTIPLEHDSRIQQQPAQSPSSTNKREGSMTMMNMAKTKSSLVSNSQSSGSSSSSSSSSSSNRNDVRTTEPVMGPTAYQNIVVTIQKRRRYIDGFTSRFAGQISFSESKKNDDPSQSATKSSAVSSSSSQSQNLQSSLESKKSQQLPDDKRSGKLQQNDPNAKPSSLSSRTRHQRVAKRPGSGRSSDPTRIAFIQQIDKLRDQYYEDTSDIFRGILYADAMRFYDMKFHEGGTYELEAIELYHELIDHIIQIRVGNTTSTKLNVKPTKLHDINEELFLDYTDKSMDGLLCSLYTALGKIYFMANMFERAVQSYSSCLEGSWVHQPNYLDALNSRASSYIVLGKYQQAGRDFWHVIQHDTIHRMFLDSFTGIARVLEANESAIPGGWDPVVQILNHVIEQFELQQQQLQQNQVSNEHDETSARLTQQKIQLVHTSLNRLYHVLFTYHDVKTKQYDIAFQNLQASYKHKMSTIPPWSTGSELRKVEQSKRIFTHGFWPTGIDRRFGSSTVAPIFIVGFVRSGSTLLERILDAHPMIAGTGENSVFNGRLDDIRNQIVQVFSSTSKSDGSTSNEQSKKIRALTAKLADDVVEEMKYRWEIVFNNTENSQNKEDDGDMLCYDQDNQLLDESTSSSCRRRIPLRFVDKMLTNYYNIGFIHMLYPEALILHVIREPMDTLLSAYKHEFPPGTLDYTSDYTSLAELYQAYRIIMDHWDDVLPGRVKHVLYEDMVKDTPGMAQAIINATGLPWDETVLNFHTKKHAVNTLSSTQVRKGIYTTSLQSWKKYQQQLQPLIDLVGNDYVFHYKNRYQTTLPHYKKPPPPPPPIV